MRELKKIMEGVTDFPRTNRENACFVDRTAPICELEKTCYTFFLCLRQKLAALKRKSFAHLDRYAQDHDLAHSWGLTAFVHLHRFAIVFQGGKRILSNLSCACALGRTNDEDLAGWRADSSAGLVPGGCA